MEEKEIIEKMEQYQNDPECAEAWFLVSQELSIGNVNYNLKVKYGSSQGYAKFKEDFEEMHGGKIIEERFGPVRVQESEETAHTIDEVYVTDVSDSLRSVVKNAFLNKVAEKLRNELLEYLGNLDKRELLLAKILKRMAETKNTSSLGQAWETYTLLTNELVTDVEKERVKEALIKTHCYYEGYGITPMLIGLPEDYLPEIKISYPEV